MRKEKRVTINVTNHLDELTSVHWHGLLVPGNNGFLGIKSGETFTYHFKIRQSGTYWYHSHSAGQEQDGLYGAIVVEPRKSDPKNKLGSITDYVVFFSDFSQESSADILSNLKRDSGYYVLKRSVGDFFLI